MYQDIVNVPAKEYEELLDEHAESENELESEEEEVCERARRVIEQVTVF